MKTCRAAASGLPRLDQHAHAHAPPAMGEQEKDIEILALRHQLIILQRQVGKAAFTQTNRMVLAVLLHCLPAEKLRQLLLLVGPDTLLRWHRDLIRRRHAATCVPKRRGRRAAVRSLCEL